MDTKKKILEVALNIFNEEGTQKITTNHIAKAARISPIISTTIILRTR